MAKTAGSALIMARPGPLRDALQALVTAMPQLDVVEETSDLPSALGEGREQLPILVLLDSALARGEICTTVSQTKARWPAARCVFLADDVQQSMEAEAAGADAVLLKGDSATRLIATLVRLLPQQAT